MRNSILSFILFLMCFSLQARQPMPWALVIHGGAGVMSEKTMTAEMQKQYLAALDKALHTGDSVLAVGGTCLDAVEKTINWMEDCPLFNAGRGAVLNHEGIAELDASVMEGKSGKAGAVAGIRDVKNPVSLARKVMEKSEHVFLTGTGASQFAHEQGLEMVPNSYFITDRRLKELQDLIRKERDAGLEGKHGTVGCVALDTYGNIAAGTSTGGMSNKRWGRIGDSPIIGAGTWADNNTGGFSCTGHGEYFIRLGFSRDVSALMEYRQLDVVAACRTEIDKLTRAGGTGGVIGLDKAGHVAMEFNTPGMFRGYIRSGGEKFTAIFKK